MEAKFVVLKGCGCTIGKSESELSEDEKLKALQEFADENEILLPTELNRKIRGGNTTPDLSNEEEPLMNNMKY